MICNYGLVRLFDMINCSVYGLSILCSELTLQLAAASEDEIDIMRNTLVPPEQFKRLEELIKIADGVATEFEWQAVQDRINVIKGKMQADFKFGDFIHQIEVLREAVDSGLKNQLIYRYPNEKGHVLKTWKVQWASVTKAFPSATPDIFAAVDCWALGHGTSCVFHSMRILEHGLRALATNLGKEFDTQNWQNIIDQIESEIKSQSKTLPRGIEKNERLKFLSEAAKEFTYFKDGWRNYVSHNRATYDEHQARSVMEHTKSFMVNLSSMLKE